MPEVHCSNSSSRPGLTRREATAVTGGSSPLPGSRYSSSSFKADTPIARTTILPIKSQAFAGDHPTPGQKSRVILKGDGMNEGAVHLEGFGERGGFGRRPALIVMDMTLGFTDPESPLGSELDSPIEVIRKLLRAERWAEIAPRIAPREAPIEVLDELLQFGEFVDIFGLPKIQKLEERFADEEVQISP